MAVRWHTVFTLSWVPRKSYGGLTASLRRPHGALTAAVRQACSSCSHREVAVRSLPGLLAVTLRFLISWIERSPWGHRNICDRNYCSPQDLTIFKNHVLQTVDRKTVRRPYGGSMICDRGIKDLSVICRALCDWGQEWARGLVSALRYPKGPWLPPISQYTIYHA